MVCEEALGGPRKSRRMGERILGTNAAKIKLRKGSLSAQGRKPPGIELSCADPFCHHDQDFLPARRQAKEHLRGC